MESPSSDVWWDKLSRVADGSVGTENEELQHMLKAVLERAESKSLPRGRGNGFLSDDHSGSSSSNLHVPITGGIDDVSSPPPPPPQITEEPTLKNIKREQRVSGRLVATSQPIGAPAFSKAPSSDRAATNQDAEKPSLVEYKANQSSVKQTNSVNGGRQAILSAPAASAATAPMSRISSSLPSDSAFLHSQTGRDLPTAKKTAIEVPNLPPTSTDPPSSISLSVENANPIPSRKLSAVPGGQDLVASRMASLKLRLADAASGSKSTLNGGISYRKSIIASKSIENNKPTETAASTENIKVTNTTAEVLPSPFEKEALELENELVQMQKALKDRMSRYRELQSYPLSQSSSQK